MPRAFLITHKRYIPEEFQQHRESSPEFHVNTAESVEGFPCCFPGGNVDLTFLSKKEAPPEPFSEELHVKTFVGNPVSSKRFGLQKNSEQVISEKIIKSSEECDDKFYNLTKLAEVSLAAASGQLFYKNNISGQFDFRRKPEQEHPEDLSRDVASSKPTEIHVCPECGKRYSTSSNLARHRQTHRSLADKKARTCPHCDKIYVSMPAFSMHVRTHNQGCKCTFCGKCFSRPWLLQGHIRTHTGEKPFKCTICAKAFADKSNLRAHVQTHSNTKPYVCERCGKAFALKSYLYKHEESSCMKTQSASERKFSEQTKRLSTRKGEVAGKPIKSIPTPVISVAIKV